MDKNAIEKFSIDARIKLRQTVESSMANLGIGVGHEPESIDSSGDVVVLNLPGGIRRELSSTEEGWRQKLIDVVEKEGYDNTVEKVAYTWFNRLIAIRYMEVNDLLPTHAHVLSSIDKGKKEPDIVSQSNRIADRLVLTDSEKREMSELRDSSKLDQLFSKMFIYECRSLNKVLPELFTDTKPYEKLLINLSYTNPDGVVRELVDTIPEEDFKDAVQIIGWMYQFYNSELKDQVFSDLKKNVKITKERIPAATQLFTPDWIVRYMVENSLGRLWLDGHPDDSLKSKWKYYLDEAEQEPAVKGKLKELRDSRRRMEPTEIKIIDPCMGSGHILVYAFDVLIQIYESYGYSKQDAAALIVENNLYGLDIDDRAYQLSYFAVMMKACQYDGGFLTRRITPNLHSILETSGLNESCLEGYGNNMPPLERNLAYNDFKRLLSIFKDAKTYGSLIKVQGIDFDRAKLFLKSRTINLYSADNALFELLNIAQTLSDKFDIVITNPPYLGSSVDPKLQEFVKDNYPDSKADLFACFIERCLYMTKSSAYTSMITQHAFMFLTSFEKLRLSLINNDTILNMAHLGARGFDQIGGEVVQTSAYVLLNDRIPDYIGTYSRLVDVSGESAKELMFLSGTSRFHRKSSSFSTIPSSPLAYWIPNSLIDAFSKGKPLSEIASPRVGLQTGENARFVRFWYEVDINKVHLSCKSREEAIQSGMKWFPYNKGGEYRKWYGNNDCVIDWQNDGERLRNFKDDKGKLRSVLRNPDYYFLPSVTWSKISSGSIAFRYKPAGHIFDVAGTSIFASEDIRRYIHGFCNSSVALAIANAISPTLNYEVGHIASFPIIIDHDGMGIIDDLVEENIRISKEEWDSYEVSWDFMKNPLVTRRELKLISKAVDDYIMMRKDEFTLVKNNEEKLNEEFIDIYGVEGDVSPSIPDDRITIRIPDTTSEILNLISYSVGVMFGRYSIEEPGLCYAGGPFTAHSSLFSPDSDNIIPINDNEYFGDDIVVYFCDFISKVFGADTLEENLRFIADNLGIKYSGTSRDGIRKYFLNNFYDDHLKRYQKCPIYWQFDSGKENGFKALIYMHRYTPDLITKMRQDYLLPMLSRFNEQLKIADGTEKAIIQKKIDEIQIYDIAMEKYASEKISIDLDDGVKANYAKFQDIENPGSKRKINLLTPLK